MKLLSWVFGNVELVRRKGDRASFASGRGTPAVAQAWCRLHPLGRPLRLFRHQVKMSPPLTDRLPAKSPWTLSTRLRLTINAQIIFVESVQKSLTHSVEPIAYFHKTHCLAKLSTVI